MTDVVARDEELGAALRELDVPALPGDFYPQLRERLRAEAELRRRRRRRRRRLGLAGSAAVAGAATLAIALSLPQRSPLAPRPALAAVVKGRVAEAYASVRTLRGMLVLDGMLGAERVEIRATFVTTARGDVRIALRTRGARIESAYDPVAGVRREVERYADGGASARVIAGVAPGPPDDAGGAETLLRRELGAHVRALLAAADPDVREVSHRGRAAWLVELPSATPACRPVSESCTIDPAHHPDRLSVTVDRATGLPVRVVATRQGEPVQELRLERLVVDAPVSRADVRLRLPAGVDVVRQEEGFRRVPLARAAALVGYRPLAPRWLPAGFRLAEVGVVPRGVGARLTNRTNPESTAVVALAYRRGLERIVVTTRARGRRTLPWSDPFAPKVTPAEDMRWRTTRARLAGGALAGAAAEVVVDGRTVPHLWALGDDLVVTVGGDADAAALVRIAGSLAAAEAR